MKRMGSSKLEKLLATNPQAVGESAADLVEIAPLLPDRALPLLVRPKVDGLDLVAWSAGEKELLESELRTHGAILFRGFGVTVPEFEAFANGICDGLYGEYGDLPKEASGQDIYQSTPYPADKTILFHNESSHLSRWPRKQFFHCVQAARERGETPIVDCRELYRRVPADLRQRLAEKGLLYLRNFKEGLDVRWQDFFKTEDPAQVERACAESQIRCEWLGDGGLRLSQPAAAVARHPVTGEEIFFNQILLHHVSCLGGDLVDALRSLYADDEMPRSVCYGDLTPIADADVQRLLDVYWQCAVAFPWQEGDVLMLDNMLVAHARNPFVGPRKIVVAMGDMVARHELPVLH